MNPQVQAIIEQIDGCFDSMCNPNPTVFKQGEEKLKAFQMNNSFALLIVEYLRSLISSPSPNQTKVFRVVIELKQAIGREWAADGPLAQSCPTQMHAQIKELVLSLLPVLENKPAQLLTEAIGIIAERDFPDQWGSLTKTLMGSLTDDSHLLNFRIWEIIAKITKKYEMLPRSDALWTEIALVLEDCHARLLYFAQGYLNQITNALALPTLDARQLKVYLQIMATILKVFYRFCYQDLPMAVEDSIAAWTSILSTALNLEVPGDQETSYLVLKMRCEGVKTIILFSSKFKEDFQDYLLQFSQQMWSICKNTPTNDDQFFDKIIVQALHFFKRFVYHSDFQNLFKENIYSMIDQLIIPNLRPRMSDIQIFEEEPEAFIENFIENTSGNSKRKQAAVEFLQNLAKAFTEDIGTFVQKLLMDFSSSDKNAPEIMETEIILLSLLTDSTVLAYRAQDGASSLILSKEFVLFAYEQIVKRNMTRLSEAMAAGKLDVKAMSSYAQFHFTVLLKFLTVFRYYLPPAELLEVAQLVSYFLVSQHYSTVSCTLLFIERVFYMRPYKENNQLGLPFTPTTIYDKVYRDPRKILIEFQGPLGTCIFNSSNIFPQVQHVLENIRKLMMESPKVIDNALICLSRLTQVLGETIGNYSEAFLAIFLDQINKMMAGFTFSSLHLIFETILTFITSTANNKPLHEVIDRSLIPVVMGLMSRGDSNITCFVLQTLAIWLRTSGKLSEGYQVVIKSVLDPGNLNQELVPIMPSFVVFIVEYARASPSILMELKAQIQGFLSFLISASLDSLFFSFFYRLADALSLAKIAELGWVDFLVKQAAAGFQALAVNRGTAYNSRPVFVKEICMFLVNFTIKTSFSDVAQMFENSAPGFLSSFLASPELTVLLTFFSQRAERACMVFAFSTILLENSGFFGTCQDVWKALLAGLLQNVQTSAKGVGSLRDMKISSADWRSYQELWTEAGAQKNSPASSSVSLMKPFQRIGFLEEIRSFVLEAKDLNVFFAKKLQQFLASNPGLNLADVMPLSMQQTFAELVAR